MENTVLSLLNCSTFLGGTILHLLLGTQRLYQHMDQSLFFALRCVADTFHIHADTLVSPQRWQDCGSSPWPCESPLSRAWHCLGEGGLTSAPAWQRACQQLRRLDNPMPVLKAVFVFLLQVQSKSSVLTTHKDDQTGLENLDSASHHP